nr:thiamine pyrophosphate-binding protein [Limnohabitans sp.]
MENTITTAQALARALSEAGVKRIFGLPGGGSSLDVIEAAAQLGIDFVLTKSENAAVMMAGAMAETTGIPGVAIMTKGPGVANGANGVAYASLDRAPVLVITDGFTPKQLSYITHQVFDQKDMLSPVVKGFSRLEGADPVAEIDAMLALATSAPFGPVHIELTGETAKRLVPVLAIAPTLSDELVFSPQDLAAVQKLIGRAQKPVLIVGLEARLHARKVRQLAKLLACPVLPTYKAKGVVSDEDPQVVGVFTGGLQEADCIAQSDLMVLIGLDPVEMILQPWRYGKAVCDIAAVTHLVHYVQPDARVTGSLDAILGQLNATLLDYQSGWQPSQWLDIRTQVQEKLAYPPVQYGVAPDRVVQLAAQACADKQILPRMSVDAGAHMFSATAFFPSTRPGDVLISNGLASMAFALPAAIASALDDPTQAVMCFTGDGGLMMCMGELCTAVETQAKIVVVVFNDSALSLIDIKQQSRQLPTRGVRWRRHDFAGAMQALGGLGFSVHNEADYKQALQTALDANGPCLIDVQIDASGYAHQLKAMRG